MACLMPDARLWRLPRGSFFHLAVLRRRDWMKAYDHCIKACRCNPVQNSFEAVEAKLRLELLMGLLTDPHPALIVLANSGQ